MPLKKNALCNVCKLISTDRKLMKRIYACKNFVPGGEPLSHIREDYKDKFTMNAIYVHAKKHQFISVEKYQETREKIQAKRAEERAVTASIKATDAIQSIIDKGMVNLSEGKIEVNTNQLLRASEIRIREDSKKEDQKIQIMEMIYGFASEDRDMQRIARTNARKKINETKILEESDANIRSYDPSVPITTDY